MNVADPHSVCGHFAISISFWFGMTQHKSSNWKLRSFFFPKMRCYLQCKTVCHRLRLTCLQVFSSTRLGWVRLSLSCLIDISNICMISRFFVQRNMSRSKTEWPFSLMYVCEQNILWKSLFPPTSFAMWRCQSQQMVTETANMASDSLCVGK